MLHERQQAIFLAAVRTVQNRADGARVVVTISLAWPSACSEWRNGNYRMGDVVQMRNVTGPPGPMALGYLTNTPACSGS